MPSRRSNQRGREYNKNSATRGTDKPQAPNYKHGLTGAVRPEADATYVMPDGTLHRWDGKCHDDCENLR